MSSFHQADAPSDDSCLAEWELPAPGDSLDSQALLDDLRERRPIAWNERLHWSVFRHADMLRILQDPQTFSSAVSTHVAVPNGMDPPQHTAYRRAIEPYFSAQRVSDFEPRCRGIARNLLAALPRDGAFECIAQLAMPFAVQVQCDFLGWAQEDHAPLAEWTRSHHAAAQTQDLPRLIELAAAFQAIVTAQLAQRRGQGQSHAGDLTAALMQELVNGQPMSDADIASILRNWTVGEIGSIAASVGILADWLARHTEEQEQLRAQPDRIPAAVEEILRLRGPLTSNRRVTRCPVQLGDRELPAGARLTLHWPAANRDPLVFDDAAAYQPERSQSANLLWGAGIHVCPGAPLAQMELRVLLEELLACDGALRPLPGRAPVPAAYPAGGWAQAPLQWLVAD